MTTSTTLGVWCVHAPEDRDPYAVELRNHLQSVQLRHGLHLVTEPGAVDLILLLVSADLKAHLDRGDLRAQLLHQRALGATVIQIIIRPVPPAALLDERLQILPRGPADHAATLAAVDRPRAADRDGVWTAIVGEIIHVAERHPRRTARPARLPAPLAEDPRRTLYVQLRRADNAVEVSYHSDRPGALPWPAVTAPLPPSLRPGGARPPDPADLFHALFPEPRAYRPVLARLFELPSEDQAVPSRYPVRLRLWCDDPALRALPWHTLVSDGFPLCSAMIGWTCEVSPAGPARTPPRTLLLPGPVVVFAPEDADEPRVRAVESVLRAALPRGAPLRCEIVRDPARLSAALNGPLVLFCCVGRGDAAGLRCGAHILPWDELAALIAPPAPDAPRPAIAYLEIDGAPPDLGATLVPALPLVAQTRGAEGPAYFPRFLDGILREHREPVAQLFHVARTERPGLADDAPLPADAVPVLVSHGDLAVNATEVAPLDEFVPLRLDRDMPRALVRRHIDDLLRSRRVEALVAYAEPGNHLERFIKQALDEVLDNGACHHHRLLHLPAREPGGAAAQEDLVRELSRQLRLQLGQHGHEDIKEVLRRDFLLDSASGPAVLWLDCGVHSVFEASHLAAWMDFCHALSRPGVCPDSLRVVVYLALLRRPDEHAALAEQIDILAELGDERLRLSLLPALPAVASADLRTYLYNRSYCDLAPDLVPAVAQELMKVTAGHYERTVAWLRKARRLGWAAVLDELRREAIHSRIRAARR